MDIVALLTQADPLGESPAQVTWLHSTDPPDPPWLIRASRITGEPSRPRFDAMDLRLPRIPGAACWDHYRWLSGDERRLLGLPEGQWLLARRPFLPGHSLEESLDTRARWPYFAHQIARSLRALHAQGAIHGDLQPRNVVIDDDGLVTLIDLPVAQGLPTDHAVAGTATTMAPEIWAGQPPSPASDVYAFAALVVMMISGGRPPLRPTDTSQLSQWARAHTEDEPWLPPDLDGRLKGLLRRGLAKAPGARPSIQEFLDALADRDDHPTPAPPFCALPPSLYRGLERNVLQGLDDTTAALSLTGHTGTGRTYALRRLLQRLQLRGDPAFLWSHGDLHHFEAIAPPTQTKNTPWEPLLRLEAACQGRTTPTLPRGDRLQIFETWATRLAAALPPDAVVLFDDLDRSPPDLRAFLTYLASRQGQPPFRLVVATDADDPWDAPSITIPLQGPDPTAWHGWRSRTLLTEVRDIPSGRWKTLVETHGARPTHLFDALNRELGASPPPGFIPRHSPRQATPDISIILARDWRRHLDGLLQTGAFTELAETCRRLFEVLHRTGRPERLEVLTIWQDALLRAGLDESLIDALEEALRATIDSPDTETDPDTRQTATLLLGRHHSELGRFDQALQTLEALPDTPDVLRWRAQALLSSGRFDDAHQTAQRGLSLLDEDAGELFGHLSVLVHAGPAIGGDRDAIESLQRLGPTLLDADLPAELRARAHAYRALGLTRRDELDAAADAYLRALEEVEAAGLLGKLPTYLLNVGTAYHRQGQLGLAREYYARGARLESPSTRQSTRALLLANQANIDITLGRLDEARPLVHRALHIAEAHNLHRIAAMCRSLSGDIALGSGDPEAALAIYRDALDRPGVGAAQLASLLLHGAEAAMQARRLPEAADHLDRARDLIEAESLADLEHHQGILRARQQWTDGGTLGTMAGIELFRRHLLGAAQAGNHRLVLAQTPHLLDLLHAEGLTELHREISDLLQSSRNAVAMGLTRQLREEFFARHEDSLPQASTQAPASQASQAPPTPASQAPPAVEDFYRMLSLNEMILHVDDLPTLFDRALDIALSLSRAERGFLLIGDRIAASRGLDGDPIPRPHLKVSRTIAEEAASTGQTVLTTNARQDGRFDSALSVVDLDLTSVLCVPVRNREGTIGALYLDHRFQTGAFHGEAPRMMEAFAHQLAIAITNGRRVDALRQERARLKEAQQALERTIEERDQALERLQTRYAALSDQLDTERHQARAVADRFPEIAFTSEPMRRLLQTVERVAASELPAVITGESGVGKELVAAALHRRSARRDGPFVPVNCGALSETLFASEMFGHKKGAFTGAERDRRGLFEAATGGTLFLDEVGELPLAMQVQLLRALQELRIRPVGADYDVSVDVRIIAATNRDLATMVQEQTFREDLYYRLAAIVLDVPPLRDRREDIPLIAEHLLHSLDPDLHLTPEALPLLLDHRWPGNVRELENTLRAASVFADDQAITDAAIYRVLQGLSTPHTTAAAPPPRASSGRGRPPKATRADVVAALDRHDGDRAEAAQHLGVSERTLYRYLNRYQIS